MTGAYDPSGWHDFAVALTSATATLTGLVFVAVSIHLQEVLADPVHRRRAGSAFVALLVGLGASLLLLFSGISRQVYGAVSVAVALLMLARAARSAVVFQSGEVGRDPWATLAGAGLSHLLLLVGGIGLLVRGASGLYVIAVSLLTLGGLAMMIVWVLFVGLSKEEATRRVPARERRTLSRQQGDVQDRWPACRLDRLAAVSCATISTTSAHAAALAP